MKDVAPLLALGLIDLAHPAQLLDSRVVEVGHLQAARAVSAHLMPLGKLRCIQALPLWYNQVGQHLYAASHVQVDAGDHLQTISMA